MPKSEMEELTLQEVAAELDVHYMTAYRYVRLGMLPAFQRGRSWVVRRDDLDAFRVEGSEGTRASGRGSADWRERLLSRMLAVDDTGAWAVVEAALASGMAPREVYTDMLTPAMNEIGARWANGDIDIHTEHAASQIASRIVARLGPRMVTRGVRRGTIVLGSTATELHVLPLSMAADLFRAARFHVVDLGVNLPPASFARAVAEADDVIAAAIGITSPGQERALMETIAAIRETADVPIIVGGAGVRGLDPAALGADAVAETADEAIAALEARRG